MWLLLCVTVIYPSLASQFLEELLTEVRDKCNLVKLLSIPPNTGRIFIFSLLHMEDTQTKQQYEPITAYIEKYDFDREMASRFQRDSLINLPSEFGKFKLALYENRQTGEIHLAIVKGSVAGKKSVPVRIHSSCVTGDILGSLRCDCREQLIKSLKYIESNGVGIVVYAFQEGRGIGLVNKLRAYALQEKGLDTVDANLALGMPEDMRRYDFVAEILRDLRVESIAVMTNNPDKINQLRSLGINVSRRIRHEIEPSVSNAKYLATKKNRMNHNLELI
jgi:3,4-dihydroxy 2-butanone 4-phosphate synthase/GTP cyclohydrolase II